MLAGDLFMLELFLYSILLFKLYKFCVPYDLFITKGYWLVIFLYYVSLLIFYLPNAIYVRLIDVGN